MSDPTDFSGRGDGHKGPSSTCFATRWLMLLSKPALCDVIVEMLRQHTGCGLGPESEAAARGWAEPVLRSRGDKIPKVKQPKTEPPVVLSPRLQQALADLRQQAIDEHEARQSIKLHQPEPDQEQS